MRTVRCDQRWIFGGFCTALSFLLGGCDVLSAPPPEPTPTPVPTPPPGVFVPEDYMTAVPPADPLNDKNPNDLSKPDFFQVTGVPSGELLYIRSVRITQKGTPPQEQPVYGTPDIVRLAGIVTPLPGQPGGQAAIQTIASWTMGQDEAGKPKYVSVEQDKKYPTDLNGRRMVQVLFTGTGGDHKGKQLSLNRMMVRSGFAVVDLHSPTSFDIKGWLNDEQYARTHVNLQTGQIQPLGLWGLGIILGQRLPPPVPRTGTRLNQDVQLRTTRPSPTSTPGPPAARP